MKLCFEIYYFDEDAFGFDVSFPEDENFIVLDENVSGNDIALLIGSLLSLNELHLNNEFIEALHKEDELALVGGLIFQKEDIIIGPSCCADLQGWREIVEGVRSEKTSWMGHDPAPWFEFSGDDIILWSDEAGSEKLFSIRYCKSEFESLSFDLNAGSEQCLVVIEDWVNRNYKDAPTELYDGIKGYLCAK